VSRQRLLESRFPSVVCAPVYSRGEGLSTQVRVGVAEGLKHDGWIMCDNLASLPKGQLTDYIGSLSAGTLHALNTSLRIALALE
jgi:mRNA interferase MazF